MNIWHYTNFKAMKGILVEGELRLCNTKGMNDKKEMFSFVTGIEKALIDMHPEAKEQIRAVFKEQIAKRENENIYGSSFSYLYNDAAQWERYGYDGSGVSIGVDMELFKKITKPYLLERVSYQKDFRNYDFLSILSRHILTEDYRQDLEKEDQIFRNLWACSGAYKDYSFKSENEIRLMTRPVSPDSSMILWTEDESEEQHGRIMYGEIQYEITNHKIREYIVFHIRERCEKFGVDFQKLITEIVIGPKSSQSKVILQNYLRKHGLDTLADHVIRSDCPLR